MYSSTFATFTAHNECLFLGCQTPGNSNSHSVGGVTGRLGNNLRLQTQRPPRGTATASTTTATAAATAPLVTALPARPLLQQPRQGRRRRQEEKEESGKVSNTNNGKK